MAFSLDPQQLIGSALTNLLQSGVIIGLPTKENPVPYFLLCEFPNENAGGSVRLPGIATQAGELRSRAVIEASTYEFDVVLSDFDTKTSGAFKTVSTVLASLGGIGNSVASFGSVLPNLSGVTTGYVSSQIATLTRIKNAFMPIMILGAYFNLGVLQQQTPYLLSKWYITGFSAPHMAGKAGVVMRVTCKEQFEPRDSSFLTGGIKALLGEVVSPLAGQVAGLLF
jgi:hypothetical protein